jgi:D-lactate dehydrogenase
MKVLHFDFLSGIDDFYIQNNEKYTSSSFNSEYNEVDESIELITCMHASQVWPHILDCFPNIRYIITRTVWMDHIDKEFCTTHGIQFFSVWQYGPQVIATHAFSLLLAWTRDLRGCKDMINKGTYDYSNVRAVDIVGKKIGVIWVGNIGKNILRFAHGFGMELYGYDVYEDVAFSAMYQFQYISLTELFSKCDIICLACNLTPENRNLINQETIALMKQWVILINIARWELIDEEALISQIEKFFFVGLDVIQDESTNWVRKFDSYNNILLTPHIAHFSDSTVWNRWNRTYEIINSI